LRKTRIFDAARLSDDLLRLDQREYSVLHGFRVICCDEQAAIVTDWRDAVSCRCCVAQEGRKIFILTMHWNILRRSIFWFFKE